jgi:ubiquinone/menaquinone biosynthesis C-methylase UbiE
MTAATEIEVRKTATFYDRIADVHNLALKLNGYKDSVAKFLSSLNLEVGPETMVLDAGSGTGIVTLAFHEAGFRPRKTIAFDLSGNSLKLALEQAHKEKNVDAANITAVQGNILSLPFANESFDIVLRIRASARRPLRIRPRSQERRQAGPSPRQTLTRRQRPRDHLQFQDPPA